MKEWSGSVLSKNVFFECLCAPFTDIFLLKTKAIVYASRLLVRLPFLDIVDESLSLCSFRVIN